MRTRRSPEPARDDVEDALAALGADDLRQLVRDMLIELDERARGRAVRSLIERAARGGTGWAPAPVGDEEVAEAVAFAKAAERAGHADPSEVDDHLRRGSAAFLRKDYAAAHRILGALLRPIGEGEIDLGQDETVDEVLGADPGECAAQYVVSAYMITAPAQRPEAVRGAIDEVRGVGHFWEPLEEMERAAVEPLPGLDDFLRLWRAVVARRAAGERRSDWDTEEDRWLREVVRRLEGSAGLAQVARSTRRADDLRAWCQGLVEARDWEAALSAFEEAAEVVADREHARGEFLDGAALAAQELGREDLPAHLERAWRAGPSMLRLRHWLGAAEGRPALRKRAAEALETCPKSAHCQRALLQLLQGDFEQAAKLLAEAPGLGWSDGEHPGHLVFPLFETLLGGKRAPASPRPESPAPWGMDLDELELMTGEPDEPRVLAPDVGQILRQAGVERIPDGRARGAALAAMRRAAERRLAGVTAQKRRRHYGHAAQLVAACLACDRSPEAAAWAASITAEYRRFSALRAEIDRRLGSL